MANRTIHLDEESDNIWKEMFSGTHDASKWVQTQLKYEKDAILDIKHIGRRLAEIDAQLWKLNQSRGEFEEKLKLAEEIERQKTLREAEKLQLEKNLEALDKEKSILSTKNNIIERYGLPDGAALSLAKEFVSTPIELRKEGFAKWVESRGYVKDEGRKKDNK